MLEKNFLDGSGYQGVNVERKGPLSYLVQIETRAL